MRGFGRSDTVLSVIIKVFNLLLLLGGWLRELVGEQKILNLWVERWISENFGCQVVPLCSIL